MNHSILTLQNQFDSILFNEGSFSTIPWLLSVGYLEYSDYERWRKGEIRYLEDHFTISIKEIADKLAIVQRHAKRLKLESAHQAYASIEQRPLRICRSDADERIFTTSYEPARNRMQSDLFFDSAPTLATRKIIEAIADRRKDAIPGLLAKLKTFSPEKYASFQRLFEQEAKMANFSETGERIDYLENILTPSALDLLQHASTDFLVPFWQDLSQDLAARPFDPERPREHQSFTAFKAFRWREVLASVENEHNWKRHPILLFRFAEACFKSGREADGFENWLELFLQFPEKAGTLIENTTNFLLLSDWRRFQELDPELEVELFPAWLILTKPALSKIGNEPEGESAAHRAFLLMRDLGPDTNPPIEEKTLELRMTLKQLNPDLFALYMAKHR